MHRGEAFLMMDMMMMMMMMMMNVEWFDHFLLHFGGLPELGNYSNDVVGLLTDAPCARGCVSNPFCIAIHVTVELKGAKLSP
jgi:hypothetical protein